MENITNVFGLPCVVAINRFPTDTEAELDLVEEKCKAAGRQRGALSEVWGKGGEGGKALAEEVVRLCEQPNDFHSVLRAGHAPSRTSCEAIVHARSTAATDVVLTPNAKKQAKQLTELGFGQYCPSAWPRPSIPSPTTPRFWARPESFTVTVRNLKVSAGAGFLVALTGDIMTMPGLPKVPAAEKIDVDENGKISGLF